LSGGLTSTTVEEGTTAEEKQAEERKHNSKEQTTSNTGSDGEPLARRTLRGISVRSY